MVVQIYCFTRFFVISHKHLLCDQEYTISSNYELQMKPNIQLIAHIVSDARI
jgi:hypothetical protein